MTKQHFSTIDRDDLEQRIAAHSLNNEDRHRGFALATVLGEGAFAMAHISGSINIPHGSDWQQGGCPIASSPPIEEAPTLPPLS
jgi:hypothetical protein